MNNILEIGQFDLPFKALITVALINVVVFFGLRLIKKYLFFVIKSENWRLRISKTWSRIALVVWTVIWLVSIIYLLKMNFLVTVVLLGLIILLGWKFWGDVIAGITIKIEDRVSIGDFLSKSPYEGLVNNLGVRGIQLRMNNGENAFIPYRHLTDFKVRKTDGDVKSELHTVEVSFKPEIAIDKAMRKLQNEVLQVPYTLLTQPVKIEIVESTDMSTILRTVIPTQSSEYGKFAEKALLIALKKQGLLV